MLYSGFDRVPKVHLDSYAHELLGRERQYVEQEMDNRLPLVSKSAYQVGELAQYPNHQQRLVRWAIAVAYSKPQHLLKIGDLLHHPEAKTPACIASNGKDTVYLKRLKFDGLQEFYQVVQIGEPTDGSGNSNFQ